MSGYQASATIDNCNVVPMTMFHKEKGSMLKDIFVNLIDSK